MINLLKTSFYFFVLTMWFSCSQSNVPNIGDLKKIDFFNFIEYYNEGDILGPVFIDKKTGKEFHFHRYIEKVDAITKNLLSEIDRCNGEHCKVLGQSYSAILRYENWLDENNQPDTGWCILNLRKLPSKLIPIKKTQENMECTISGIVFKRTCNACCIDDKDYLRDDYVLQLDNPINVSIKSIADGHITSYRVEQISLYNAGTYTNNFTDYENRHINIFGQFEQTITVYYCTPISFIAKYIYY